VRVLCFCEKHTPPLRHLSLFFRDHPPPHSSPHKIKKKNSEDDTVGDLKKLVAAQTGTRPDKIRIQKWHTVYKVDRDGKNEREREKDGGRVWAWTGEERRNARALS
jgi:hypothetical protein